MRLRLHQNTRSHAQCALPAIIHASQTYLLLLLLLHLNRRLLRRRATSALHHLRRPVLIITRRRHPLSLATITRHLLAEAAAEECIIIPRRTKEITILHHRLPTRLSRTSLSTITTLLRLLLPRPLPLGKSFWVTPLPFCSLLFSVWFDGDQRIWEFGGEGKREELRADDG